MTEPYLVDVSSTYLAVADASRLDAFTEATSDLVDGVGSIPACGWLAIGGGIVCGAGWGDGAYEVQPSMLGDMVDGFSVLFDDERGEWVEAGEVELGSGLALVGDPGYFSRFEDDFGAGPVAACDLWACIHFPGPTRLGISLMQVFDGMKRNVELRAVRLAG